MTLYDVVFGKTATGRHGAGKETPRVVSHIARTIAEEKGMPKSRAYAITTGQMQNIGALRRGKMDLTAKGERLARRHSGHRP